MPSSYTDLLRLEKQANSENSNTWGDKLNTVFEMIEDAISGRASVTHNDSASYTLTIANSSTDESRNMILNIGGALSADRNVVCPTSSKFYVVKNATSGGHAITLKTSGGTGISVPNGSTMVLFCDGTNVVDALNYLTALTTPSLTATGGTINNAAIGGTTPAAGAFTTLSATGLCDLSGAGAGQIKFPATQNASADANTLDDYEEGTWIPQLAALTGSPTIPAATIQGGTYTKIGREVNIRGYWESGGTITGTLTGAAVYTGLPFACNSTTRAYGWVKSTYQTNFTYPASAIEGMWHIQNSESQIRLSYTRSGLPSISATANEVKDAGFVSYFSGGYHV